MYLKQANIRYITFLFYANFFAIFVLSQKLSIDNLVWGDGTLFSPLQIMPGAYSGFLITSGLAGGSNIFDLENKSYFVPVIKLNNGTTVSTGTGIKTDPYVIE